MTRLTGSLVDLTAVLARNLASRKKSSGRRSHLIKTPDWISERPPRGGLSVCADQSALEDKMLAGWDQEAACWLRTDAPWRSFSFSPRPSGGWRAEPAEGLSEKLCQRRPIFPPLSHILAWAGIRRW